MAVLRALRRSACWLFMTWGGRAVLVLVFLLFGLRLVAPHRLPEIRVEPNGSDTLVVVLHGLGGDGGRLQSMLQAVERHYPGADRLAPVYTMPFIGPVSNVDPYELTNAIEQTIHEAYERRKHAGKEYKRIVLVGYSMGALLLRKTIIWAYGEEDDRVGRKGTRAWVEKIDRVVSLAGMSRGWSIDPPPSQMSWLRYALYWAGEKFVRLTGTGKLLLSMQRGAPFVADSRVQWIRIAREYTALPPVVHLLGDRDDIVSIDDSRDLAAAHNVRFVTMADTDHVSILKDLKELPKEADLSIDAARRRKIEQALGGDLRPTAIGSDEHKDPVRCEPGKMRSNDPGSATRIVYVMHGIRDHADWADRIRAASAEGLKGKRTVTVPAKYGYFPMIPFLLYYDRHKNVRWFMDAYTNHLAEMPCLERVDFVGHSNGTYILASALQHYKTLNVGYVYFAGSVVPKHYRWIALKDRVQRVYNVKASGDWVVAFFPRLFEQIAEWLGTEPTDGVLDLGSGGFRGFQDGGDPSGKVVNISYVTGGHGAGVDITDSRKLEALAAFVVDPETSGELLEKAFYKADDPDDLISFVSNIAWAVWLLLAAALAGIGWLLWHCRLVIDVSRVPRTINLGFAPFAIFVAVVVLLLFSV